MIALNSPGYAVPAWHGVLLTIGAVLFTIVFNTILLRKLPTFEGGMLVLHVFAFFAILVVLWVMGDKAPAQQVFTEFSDPQGWGSVRQTVNIMTIESILTCIYAEWSRDVGRISCCCRFSARQ